ncbi:MAG: phosphoribosyltransferase [Helicobacteraceae bacterium]|nr:phosphoribosyltransferase [Helicobacteraceae bacterium]
MKEYNFEEFNEDVNILYNKLCHENIDTIVALARGGLMLAQLLAYKLDIRDVQSIQTISYDKNNKLNSVTVIGSINIKDRAKVLIVDDIVDSGDTLKTVLDLFKRQYKTNNFISASIFFKNSALIQPNYKVKEATEWIDFFWEKVNK